jgi:predicted RNase H-like nuclease (RuvC/YqgF family)
MAEDFHEAFEVGSSEERINSINADGVALAAIQGLSEQVEEKDERIEELESTVEAQRAELDALRAELDEIRADLHG